MRDAVAVLHDSLTATGRPVVGVSILSEGRAAEPGWLVVTRGDGVRVRLDMADDATQQQIQDAQTLVLNATLGARQPRDLRAIVADLDALTTQQKGAIWTAISSGSPWPRWTLSNNATVWICMRMSSGLTGAFQTNMRLLGVAAYCRDENPAFLVHPSFDATINVPGDEPA